MELRKQIIGLALSLVFAIAGASAEETVLVDKAPPTATLIAKNLNAGIYARLVRFSHELVPALESNSPALQDGTLFYKLKLDPHLAAQQVSVFHRNGELVAGQALTMNRLPMEVHKKLEMEESLYPYFRPRPDDETGSYYQLFFPLRATGENTRSAWSWVLFVEVDIQRALPKLLEQARLLRSDNVLIYANPKSEVFNLRNDGIDFSVSRSFRDNRRAVHDVTLTDLLRSDDAGERRLTFLTQAPPKLVDSIVSWDKNPGILGEPWIVVHSAKARRGETDAVVRGEWVSLPKVEGEQVIKMAMATDSSSFKMMIEHDAHVYLSEGRFLNNTLTAHQTRVADKNQQVLGLSGSYFPEHDKLSLRLVLQSSGKVKVWHYTFARRAEKAYKEPKAKIPHIKLRAFN